MFDRPGTRRRCVLWGAALFSLFFFQPIRARETADFYVSTRGKDTWSGRLAEPKSDGTDGPFATFRRAQEAVRELKRKDATRAVPILVAIRGGTYFLDRTILFSPADSGSRRSPVRRMNMSSPPLWLSSNAPGVAGKSDDHVYPAA